MSEFCEEKRKSKKRPISIKKGLYAYLKRGWLVFATMQSNELKNHNFIIPSQI